METIRTAISQPLHWLQPKGMRNAYELRAGELLYGTLTFPKWYQSLAQAEAAGGQWVFDRKGFLNLKVPIWRVGETSEQGIYVYNRSWTTGQLNLANGSSYTWKSLNFWATHFNWIGPGEQVLVTFHQGVENGGLTDFFKTQARVEIAPQAAHLPELPLLVLLGWYLMVLKQHDTAAAVAAS